MADDMKEWLESVTMFSEDTEVFNFKPIENSEDPIPFSDSISAYVFALQSKGASEILQKSGIQTKNGFLITGPEGTGKHKTATSILTTLLNNGTYSQWIWLAEDDFYDVDDDEAQEQIMAIFSSYAKRSDKQKMIFLLEYPERYSCRDTVINTITECVIYCEDEDIEYPLVIIVTEENIRKYPRLSSKLTHFRFRLPNLQQRISYLSQHYVYSDAELLVAEYNKIRISDMSINDFAEKAKGINYNRLAEIVSLSKLLAVQKAFDAGVHDATSFIMSHYPLTKDEIIALLPEENNAAQIVTQQIIQTSAPMAATVSAAENKDTQDLESIPDNVFSEQFYKLLDKHYN